MSNNNYQKAKNNKDVEKRITKPLTPPRTKALTTACKIEECDDFQTCQTIKRCKHYK